MLLLKKRIFPALLCLLLLTAAFALPLTASAAPPSVEEAAAAGLAYYKSAYEAGYEGKPYKADMWTQLIRRGAGKLGDADFAFLSPEVDADGLLTLPTVSSGTPKLDAAKIAKGIITLLAQGKTPGDQNVAKLVKALAGLQEADGAFGEKTATTAIALVALRCAGYGDFDRDKAVSALVSKKFPDGGYNDWGDSGSPEGTAFVMMGLAAADTAASKTALAGAIAFLKTVWQQADGFFHSPAEAVYNIEPNNCIQSTVLLALVTAGEDVTSAAWKTNGISIADTILSLQDTTDFSGGFWYSEKVRSGENTDFPDYPDQYTNYQVLLGLYAQLGGSPLTKLFREFQTASTSVASVTESSKPAPNPPTGDRFNPIVWVVLIVAVIAVIVVVLLPVIRKKK